MAAEMMSQQTLWKSKAGFTDGRGLSAIPDAANVREMTHSYCDALQSGHVR